MSGAPQRLIYMANQIAKFFVVQPKGGAASVAQHLRDFWEPGMRAEIIAWRTTGGEGLDPMTAEAVDLLSPDRVRAP